MAGALFAAWAIALVYATIYDIRHRDKETTSAIAALQRPSWVWGGVFVGGALILFLVHPPE